MFTDSQYREAKESMNRLMSHPISSPFIDPIGDNPPENYYKIIQNPKHLKEIYDNLEKKKYKHIKEWYDDVETVWSNAELFHGKNTAFGIAAAENRKIFQKEKVLFEESNTQVWCKNVYDTRTYLTDMMNNLPPKIKQFTDSLGTARFLRRNKNLPNEKEINNFIKATEMISDEKDQLEMIRLFKEKQPELDNGDLILNIDVASLNNATFNKLRDYVKLALEKQNKKYPE